jgi:hypothetical protein
VSFPDNKFNHFSNTELSFNDSKIIILKKVKSLRQLRRTEKELVKLCYKEAIIKGFTLKGIQQYIASKTKIWIEWSCLEYLKKAEEQENREWYFRLAKDQFAYINIFRKAIDEIEEYKKQLWLMVLDREVEHPVKVQAVRELHSLSKTYTLLLKDLPFVTLLTKHHDKNLPRSDYNYSDKRYSNNQEFERNLIKEKDIDNIKDKKIIANNDNNFNSNKNSNTNKHVDDEVMEVIMRQTHMTDCLKGKNYAELTEEDLEKVITPEYNEAVKRVKELLDE